MELTRIHSQTPSLDLVRTAADGSGGLGLLARRGLGKSDGLYGWEVSVKGFAHDVCGVAVKRALKRPMVDN